MNDPMHIVTNKWYRLYWWILLLLTGLITAGCALVLLLPDNSIASNYNKNFHLGATTLFMAALGLTYSLSAYWIIKRRDESLAILVQSVLFTLLVLNGLVVSTPDAGVWVFSGLWLLMTFFAPMFGPAFGLGVLLLTIIYVLLQSRFGLSQTNTAEWVLLASTILAVTLGYAFWRKKYVADETKTSHLAGMLRSNQEQSATIIQSIADGVIVVATDGKISLINLAAGLLTGWSVVDATGVDVQSVVSLKQENGTALTREDNPFTLALNTKRPLSRIAQMTSRDDTVRTVSLVVSPVILGGGELAGVVAVLRDVSEQRAAEQQRAEFISTASHEMRTPVAAIEGYLALALNDKVSTIDSRARGFLDKAHSSTQHLGKLFQDLLTSSKAEDGRLSNHPVVVEIGALLEQLVEDLRFSAQKKGLTADFVIGTSQSIDATRPDESQKVIRPLYYVHVDPDRLREVIGNILDNAVKYTEQGRISIGLTGNSEIVQFYVRDTGPGIPAEDIAHLFQKFYRVDNSATRTIGGTGLGLFIARKIVELYHGRIWAESRIGKGTVFFTNLPRLSTQRAAALQATEAITPAPPPEKL